MLQAKPVEPSKTPGPKVSHAASVNMSAPETKMAVLSDTSTGAGPQPEPTTPDGTKVSSVSVPITPVTPQAEPVLFEKVAPQPNVAATSVLVTRRPKNEQSKESRSIKRLSSSGEDSSNCTQSRSFRALEHMLFEGNDL